MKSDKPNLGDVIHLYFGQQVFVPENNKIATFTGLFYVPGGRDVIVDVHYSESTDDWDVFNDNLDEFDRIKPILSKLSDLTDEQQEELWHLDAKESVIKMENSIGRVRRIVVCPERTEWLRCNSFDLFNLIDRDLAIDKKTLKP